MLCVLVILPIFLVVQVQCDYKLVIAYGEPESYTASQNYSLDWEDCVTSCLANTSCLVIYEVDSETCQIFTVGQITSAKRLSSGNRIGVKSYGNSTTCPTELTAYEDTGYELTDTTYKSYTVNYNDSLWTISIVESLSCPTNFKIFIRSLGFRCLQLIDTEGCYTRTGSSGKCQNTYGGLLSGPENSDEYDFLLEKALVIWKLLSGFTKLAVWVDGDRKSACSTQSSKTATCNGTNEFSFTDPTLSTVPQGYKWLTNEPSGMGSVSVTETCIVLKINNSTNNGLDDCGCSTTKSTQVCVRGYLCGLAPTSA